MFFLGNIPEENVFDNALEQKNVFVGYKNKKFQKSKHWHFSKGVNPWFWSKNGPFFPFFLGNIGQENFFDNILERKNAFEGYKSKKFKKSKNWRISKGVNPWFWSKNGYFFNFFLGQENVFDNILERKNAFEGYKNKKFKKSRHLHISKGVNPWFSSKNGHFLTCFF